MDFPFRSTVPSIVPFVPMVFPVYFCNIYKAKLDCHLETVITKKREGMDQNPHYFIKMSQIRIKLPRDNFIKQASAINIDYVMFISEFKHLLRKLQRQDQIVVEFAYPSWTSIFPTEWLKPSFCVISF